MTNEKTSKRSDWELEQPFDAAATLDELINDSPFKEASDEGGQSTTAGTRIPTWLLRRIVKLKELPGSPYELNSDVIRDALYRGLRILHLKYKMSPDWEVETKLAAAVDATSAARRIRGQAEDLIAGVDEMYRDGDVEKAAESLSAYVLAAVELESEWHRDKLFRVLAESKAVAAIAVHCNRAVQMVLEKEKKKRK